MSEPEHHDNLDARVTLKHRGKTVSLPAGTLTPDATLGTLRVAVADAVRSEAERTKLLAPGILLSFERDDESLHKILTLCSRSPLPITILASSSSSSAAPATPRLHDDLTVNSTPSNNKSSSRFVARPRSTSNSRVCTASSSDYGFGSVEALDGYCDRSRAQAVLERLATDAGILHVMSLRGWRVGALREMPPIGRVGREACVLGFNRGRGMEIRLRLRTDDNRGFRGVDQLLHVLAHELAHNVEDEHGVAFKETMRWIERELAKKDWRGQGGRVLEDGAQAQALSTRQIAQQVDEGTVGNGGGGGGRLGGSATTAAGQQRGGGGVRNVAHSRLVRDAGAKEEHQGKGARF